MPSAKPANILLVDDRQENLLALEASLEPLGQCLFKASSGEEALKCLLKHDFAVILLDVQMPGMSGFELAEVIKQREKTRHVPIIFLTAINKDQAYVFQGYSVGAVDYLFKPLDPDILRSKVAVFIELHQKNAQIREQAAKLHLAEQRERARERAELAKASALRYRNLADAIPNIIWTSSPDGEEFSFNRLWFDYTQLNHESRLEDTWRRVVHPEDWERFITIRTRAREQGKPASLELRLRRGTDGRYRWHQLQWQPEHDESGQIIAWLGSATDIDDKMRAQEALLNRNKLVEAEVAQRTKELGSQKRLIERVLDNAPAGIAFVDAEGICRAVNPEFVRFSGLPAEQMLNAPIDEALTRCGMALAPYLGEVIHSGEPFRALGYPFGKAGDRQPYWDIVFYPLLDEEGRLDGVLLFSLEVSARVENERMQKDQIERLKQIDTMKDEFLSVVSHELRTPLNFITGFASVLQDEVVGPLSDAQHDYMDKILKGADRMLMLVNDLLDYAKIRAGEFELTRQQTEYAPLVGEVLDTLKPLADQKGLTLDAEVDPAIAVEIDEQRIIQLLTNLVSNGIKFTPAGGRVAVRAYLEGQALVTEVVDTGIGIATDDIPKLFTRFRQLDMSTTREAGGTGLGLSITKMLVEAHGGEITARSPGLGNGASFRFTLPLSASATVAEEQPATHSPS
ncbi:MAG TPA: ATP-binding protein [Oscillatoriaceae cyanobacterium]